MKIYKHISIKHNWSYIKSFLQMTKFGICQKNLQVFQNSHIVCKLHLNLHKLP